MEFKADIKGVEELNKTFAALPGAARNKALRPALRAGANIIKVLAKENVEMIVSDEATGKLARSIVVSSLRNAPDGSLRVAVRIRPKAVNSKKIVNGQPVRVGLYGAVLEYRPGKSWLRRAAKEGAQNAGAFVALYAEQRMDQAVAAARRGATE